MEEKVMLSGRAKENFEKWYRLEYSKNKENNLVHPLTAFKYFHLSMQWGVIVDWADSVGCEIELLSLKDVNILINGKGKAIANSRQEAREKAIEKLNEIYNDS